MRKNRRYANKSLVIEWESIRNLACRCDGCPGKPCCCDEYEILVTGEEIRRIDAIMPEVVQYCPDLICEDGYENVFESIGEGLHAIDKTDTDRCVFQYDAGAGESRCALHSVAMDRNEDPFDRKPIACSLWPMGIGESETEVLLTADEDAARFDCVTRDEQGDPDVLHAADRFAELFETVHKK